MRVFLFLSYFVCFNAFATLDLDRIDPDRLITRKILIKTINYYQSHLSEIKNRRFVGVVDFKQHNSKERFFIIDMESGLVEKYLVAHGKNSDPNFSGFATAFSNIIDSQMSSLGFYLTAETYDGANGYSLRLDGLSTTNSNARERGIVIHGANYVAPGNKIGRSFGCPAVEMRYHQQVIDLIKNGALIYASFE